MTLTPLEIKALLEDRICEDVVRTLAAEFRPIGKSLLDTALDWHEVVRTTVLPGSRDVDTTHRAKELKAAAASLQKSASLLRKFTAVEEVRTLYRVMCETKPDIGRRISAKVLPKVMESQSIPQILEATAQFWMTLSKHHALFMNQRSQQTRLYVRRLPVLLYAKEMYGELPDFSALARELQQTRAADRDLSLMRGLETKTLRSTWSKYQDNYLPTTTRLIERLWITWHAQPSRRKALFN